MIHAVSRLDTGVARAGHGYSQAVRAALLGAAAGFALLLPSLPAYAGAAGAPPAEGAPVAKTPAAKAPAAKAPAAKAPAAAGAAAAADDKKRSQWVKLCDKIKIAPKPAADGKKAEPQEKQLCSTMFEAIESNTGQVIVSVGLQQIEGAPKEVLAVMVPLGVVIPGGVKLAVYSADQWAKAAKNETIELKDLKTADLKFAHCLPVGCTAETQATPEMVEMLKGNAGLAVLAIWANGNQFTVPVSLVGFGDALAGKPIDNKQYQEGRKRLMDQIRQRQAELYEKKKAEEMKNLPPMPGNAATAPPAATGAAKKQ